MKVSMPPEVAQQMDLSKQSLPCQRFSPPQSSLALHVRKQRPWILQHQMCVVPEFRYSLQVQSF
jgi:hypothetical protein